MNIDANKFRVWDIENESYVDDLDDLEYCGIKMDGTLDCVFAGDVDTYPPSYLKTEDAVIEKCTGKKDKNNNLIYAGDIVKTVTGKIGTVVWWEYRAKFAIMFNGTMDFACDVDETQEIIGNIHEVKK